MSPYLFVLVMEIWNSLLRFRIRNAPEFQYHWKCKELGLTNLCFADDVLLFCKAHLPSIKVLTNTLTEFATLSGLKVNPAKSQIILSSSVQQERQQILEYLGFHEGSLPIRYLGIPLTSSRLTIADCRPLIDKVDARLAGWNNQNLSYAGRLQLIKSVLSTLNTYWASAFILPKGILKSLEKKMRRFLWHGSSGSGIAKVAWVQVCKPKEEGGLGISSLIATNQALMLKQLWRILQHDGNSIWVDWVYRYRLRHSTIWTFNGTTGSWGWKKLLKLRPLLRSGVTYKIGDGSSFNLWQDVWHERGPLCLTYPQGPRITGLPLTTLLSSVLQRNQWCWPASIDAEIVAQLPPTDPTAADTIYWNSSSGTYSLKSAVSLIQPSTPRVLWYGLLQGKFKVPRHGFVLWLAIMEKLSTMDKPWVPRAENGCVLCDGHFNETHEHLFFNCWYSKRCLSILKSKIRFHWPYSEWQRGLIWASKKWRGNHLVNAAFRATLAALVYHLWIERNNRKFTATSTPAESITGRVLEDVRMRILAVECPSSLQVHNLYRIWHLAWPIGT
ncbi:UNVERIFIED_CONTAM: hypothetical protein Sangu_3204000 [Sesamum angustifolium]|uniref:Reverse transcriptase domain-containing protein n=1 Tax=Sesamum angustifolium TaxID=2727405 RepID=A0AAW2JM12_9LAMI